MRTALRQAGAGVLCLLACSSSGNSPRTTPPATDALGCFVGDQTAAPEISMFFLSGAGTTQPIAEMTEIPLLDAPQGGKHMLIGVQARNLDGCPLNVTAVLSDAASSQVISLERRPITLAASPDGVLLPKQQNQEANYSNLPACPRAGLSQPIDGVPYQLRVVAEDPAGRQATVSHMVVPTCRDAADYARCTCLCSPTYRLGVTCN